MAEKTPVAKEEDPIADAPLGGAAAAPSGKSLVAKLIAIVFVLGVVLAECLAAYFFLPTATSATAMAGNAPASEAKAEGGSKSHAKGGKEKKEGKEGKEGKAGKEAASDQIEVDLGEYSVTSSPSSGNSTLQITFHLYGTVATADEKELQELKQENEHRFREQVLVVVRGARISDLTDAGLGLLKRNILEKTNKVLGKPILQSVIFSDFVFIEQ